MIHPPLGLDAHRACEESWKAAYAGPVHLTSDRIRHVNASITLSRLIRGTCDEQDGWLITTLLDLVATWAFEDAGLCGGCAHQRIQSADGSTWTCMCPGGDAA